MKTVVINNQTFQLHSGYQQDESRRQEFNRLMHTTWGFDFENYYQCGYWDETCILHTLFDGDKAVSHVTVSLFRSVISSRPVTLLQQGTVMTDKAYQRQGLSRWLMEYIAREYKDQVYGMFLFANDTVLDFYPRFGFVPVKEYQAFKKTTPRKADIAAKRRLNMDNAADLQLMENLAKHAMYHTVLPVQNYSLLFFYCYAYPKFGFRDSVYYIESLQAAVVAQQEDDTLHILEICAPTAIALDDVIAAFADDTIHTVALGFAPVENGFSYREHKEEDLTLFVSPELLPLFQEHRYMIPVLSHT
ncbi:GNAT family N-acetyltransferase [Chitinophaga sp. Mgbs1]|uniref:GNAT family N-acetyltransferase n=1 Tax=Chitinophaga solisilvae TaxID=1233460 RepID=A0A3S1BIB1_9BACT|nr:GNAT family N-acetyltransferase [Chitinophaga solisilvae]